MNKPTLSRTTAAAARPLAALLAAAALAACGGGGAAEPAPGGGLAAPALGSIAAPVPLFVGQRISAIAFANTGGGSITGCAPSPALPGGLAAAPAANGSTCQITGVPTAAAAQATYTVTATNAGGSGMATVAISVAAQPGGDVLPSLASITGVRVLTAGQAAPAIAFANSGGGELSGCTVSPALPERLAAAPTANSSTCQITGTPTAAAGQTTYTVTATNATGTSMATVDIAVTAQPGGAQAPMLANIATPLSLTVGQRAPATTFTNTGGGALTGCAPSPALPMGLVAEPTADRSTCQITGMPTAAAARATYTVTATNATGTSMATVDIAVAAGEMAPNLADVAAVQLYEVSDAITTITFANSGGGALTDCTVSPGLPMGLAVAATADNMTCEIKGTIDAVGPGTSHTVTATNATGSSDADVDIAVLAAGAISQALDTSALFASSGDVAWSAETATTPSTSGSAGTQLAQVAGLTAGQSSCLYTRIDRPGELGFYWRREPAEPRLDPQRFVFLIDGRENARLAGNTDWAQHTASLSPPAGGMHLLSWCLVRNADAGVTPTFSLDQFSFVARPAGLAALVTSGTAVTLSWREFPDATHYQVFRSTAVTVMDTDEITSGTTQTATSYDDTGLTADTSYRYWVKACDANSCSNFSEPLLVPVRVVDADGDGLIDINTLAELNGIRGDLSGGAWVESPAVRNAAGCGSGGCQGYELLADLDFDTDDADTTTWARANDGSITLDADDDNDGYLDIQSGGWAPIGDCGEDAICLDDANTDDADESADNRPFNTVFEGNSNTISNLAVRRGQALIGLFGSLGGAAVVRKLSVTASLADLDIPTSNPTDEAGVRSSVTFRAVGILAGLSEGEIRSCSSSGLASGEGGSNESVGGLVGYMGGGSITASHSSASVNGDQGGDYVGGLVGRMAAGSITASYASGEPNGGGGTRFGLSIYGDYTGGLVGNLDGGSITASYATGHVPGSSGYVDRHGGLVGNMGGGSITASYATGSVSGGQGPANEVGGLVGRMAAGSITASYALGDAYGGHGQAIPTFPPGEHDDAGALVGLFRDGATLVHSWGYGTVTGQETTGPLGSETGGSDDRPFAGITIITDRDIYDSWKAAGSNTLMAWDFGNGVQTPAINYADYDGAGNRFHCEGAASPPAGAILIPECSTAATLIPGQRRVRAPAGASLEHTMPTSVTITWDPLFNADNFRIYRGTSDDSSAATEITAAQTRPTATEPEEGSYTDSTLLMETAMGNAYYFWVAGCGGEDCSPLAGPLFVVTRMADADGDGLIEIYDNRDLYNVRFSLDGSRLAFGAGDEGTTFGCSGLTGCVGYELENDLDLDDGAGAVDVSNWSPIGGCGGDNRCFEIPVTRPEEVADNTPFTAIFDGNGHTISNLTISSRSIVIGLFGLLGEGAEIRNLGVLDADLTAQGANYAFGPSLQFRPSFVGGLVGLSLGGRIVACHTTGAAAGSANAGDNIGGLVGLQQGGAIVASFANLGVAGSESGGDRIGGLVGLQNSGSIVASYAAGAVNGGEGASDFVGGLVGFQHQNGSIIASYASGNATAGSQGDSATTGDIAGALTGVAASATGGTITDSFGFGTTSNGGDGSAGSAPLTGVTAATGLTAANAPASWSAAATPAMGAWDFGDPAQAPALNYADYDGPTTTAGDGTTSGDGYHCAGAASPPDGATLVANCATGPMLIPNQRAVAAPGQ